MTSLPDTFRQLLYRTLALANRSRPTLQTHAAELTALGVIDSHTIQCYMDALKTRLGVGIEIKPLSTGERHMDAYFARGGRLAEMTYDDETNTVYIFLPESVRQDAFLYIKTVCHELGHIAAGHPLPLENTPGGLWWPPRSLAPLPAPANLQGNEEEADLRADWLLISSVLGIDVLQTQRSFGAL